MYDDEYDEYNDDDECDDDETDEGNGETYSVSEIRENQIVTVYGFHSIGAIVQSYEDDKSKSESEFIVYRSFPDEEDCDQCGGGGMDSADEGQCEYCYGIGTVPCDREDEEIGRFYDLKEMIEYLKSIDE